MCLKNVCSGCRMREKTIATFRLTMSSLSSQVATIFTSTKEVIFSIQYQK